MPPANFQDITEQLYVASQELPLLQADFKRKHEESVRLSELATKLFNQAAEAERNAAVMEQEAQGLVQDITAKTAMVKEIMQRLNQVCGLAGAA